MRKPWQTRHGTVTRTRVLGRKEEEEATVAEKDIKNSCDLLEPRRCDLLNPILEKKRKLKKRDDNNQKKRPIVKSSYVCLCVCLPAVAHLWCAKRPERSWHEKPCNPHEKPCNNPHPSRSTTDTTG
jgi:hypothetical protein